MTMQLTLDFTPRPQRKHKPILTNTTWMDVSEIAKGVGFTSYVEVSHALNDALAPLQMETDEAYDQRLYDALWLAHHVLSMDQRPSSTFTFDFTHEDNHSGRVTEASLRLRVEVQQQTTHLGISRDF